MKLTPYLVFNGQANEALEFYSKMLHGSIGEIHRFGSLPDSPKEYRDRILHSTISFDDGTLKISDTLPNDKSDFGQLGHRLTLQFDSADKLEAVYAVLCQEAQQIRCELSETFFAKRYCEVYDRFGVLWELYMAH